MNILYIGDIMGMVGIEVVESVLPHVVADHRVDTVIAQAENVTNGKGISVDDYERLQGAGVHFFTGGNHIFEEPSIIPYLNNSDSPIIRPANYPMGKEGLGFKYLQTTQGKILIVSLLGDIVGKHAGNEMQNPLKVIDAILAEQAETEKIATIINFHGDYSSQKVIIGNYLDGRVTAVIGDHWHVQSADAQVLPKGTAHISDVGMCGSLDSSLGVTFDSVIRRWRDGEQTKNILETTGRRQFNAVLVEVASSKANSIKTIRQILD